MIRNSLLVAGIVLALASAGVADQPLRVLHPGDVILFQGDSITDGGRQRSGSDYNHIMGQDYAYIIAAEVGAEFPERHLTFVNRGVGGNTVLDAAKRWQSDTLDLKPNLLSILLGVNDTLGRSQTAEGFEQTYGKLLADTVAALPATKIVLGAPFLLPVGNHRNPYAAELAEVRKRQAAVARLAARYHLPLIDYQSAFDAACRRAPADHWSWDGVHPTYAGHGLMAREWLRTVAAFWPKG